MQQVTMHRGSGMTQNVRLSPSDFAFLWEDCPRCFYMKVKLRFARPFGVMPKIFTNIDTAMKRAYHGKRLLLGPGVPPGVIRFSDKWVQSDAIAIPNRSLSYTIVGKFDTVIEFEDGTYGVIDFKTSSVKDEHIPLYSRQLHAYALALEWAGFGRFALAPISRLGLLVFEPAVFSYEADEASLSGGLSWCEMPRDDATFLAFLNDVLELLERPELPPPGPGCSWCRYREDSRVERATA